jgi:hypothetical protein
MEQTLKEVFEDLTRVCFLVVTMLVKRKGSRSSLDEAVQRLATAQGKLQSLLSIDRNGA